MNLFKGKGASADGLYQKHEENVKLAENLGKETGLRGVTVPGEDTSSYFVQLVGAYNELIARYVTSYLSKSTEASSSIYQNLAKEKALQLEARIKELEEKLRRAVLGKKELPAEVDFSKYRTLHVLLVGLGMFEAFFTYRSFDMYTHSSNVAGLMVFVGLTVVFTILPLAAAGTIRSTEDSPHKWWIRIGLAAVVLGSFLILGIMRGVFVQRIGATTMEDVKAVSTEHLKSYYFSVLSLLFLCLGTYLCLQFPSKRLKQNTDAIKKADKEIQDIETQMEDARRELGRIPENLAHSETTRHNQIAEAREKAGVINNLFYQAAGAMIQANGKYRQDGKQVFTYSQIPTLEQPNF